MFFCNKSQNDHFHQYNEQKFKCFFGSYLSQNVFNASAHSTGFFLSAESFTDWLAQLADKLSDPGTMLYPSGFLRLVQKTKSVMVEQSSTPKCGFESWPCRLWHLCLWARHSSKTLNRELVLFTLRLCDFGYFRNWVPETGNLRILGYP